MRCRNCCSCFTLTIADLKTTSEAIRRRFIQATDCDHPEVDNWIPCYIEERMDK